MATINGTSRGDQILPGSFSSGVATSGTPGNVNGADTIRGLAGPDRIDAGPGIDSVLGGTEIDTLQGGDGNDTLDGEAGDDVARGGAGNDRVLGDAGRDVLYGDGGTDELLGEASSDTLYGGDDADVLRGGTPADSNVDRLYGGGGNDQLLEVARLDEARGEDGDDTIELAREGAALIDGGLGTDTLIGGLDLSTTGITAMENLAGSAILTSRQMNEFSGFGVGAETDLTYELLDAALPLNLTGETEPGDTFQIILTAGDDDLTFDPTNLAGALVAAQGGDDRIVGSAGRDVLDGGPGGNDLTGAAGGDTLFGGELADTMRGDAGDDFLFSYEGADVLNGGDGDDRIFADDDADRVDGGLGADSIDGGVGSDTISGGDGSDRLDGGEGGDAILGGAGADTFLISTYDGSGDTYQFFRFDQGDRVTIDLAAVQNDTGAVRTDLVRAVSSGRDLQLQFDSDFASTNGFDPVTVATLDGPGGRRLADILDNELV